MGKKMKVTYRDALEAESGVQQLGNAKMLWKATVKLVRLGRELKEVVEEFQEVRMRLVEKHGLKEGDPPSQEFIAEVSSLLEEKVEVSNCTLRLSEIGNGSGPEIGASALIALGPFLEDDWEEEAMEEGADEEAPNRG